MKALIFGDSNVDVTVSWKDAETALPRLSPKNRKLISAGMSRVRKEKSDVEIYLPRRDPELSDFFSSLSPRVEFGGCGALKARGMARLGHKVVFYSWVGDDGRGAMILDELSDAGVDVSNVLVDGQTCETYNIFNTKEARLAFSFWEPKLDFSKFASAVKREKPDLVLLTGAHRSKAPLGYGSIPNAYVFTGSFAPYTKTELANKYASDLSKGILVANDAEILQLSGETDPRVGMLKLRNEIVVMHGQKEIAVKRCGKIISVPVEYIDPRRIKEKTGIGDIWEAVFLGKVGDLKTAPEAKIRSAMRAGLRAATRRMIGR